MTILLATCRQQLQKGDWNLNLKLKKQHLRKVCFYLHTEESRCHWNWFKGFNSTGSFPNHHQNCWSKERMFPERTKSLTCLMATDRSVCCCTVRDRHCKQNKTQFTTVCNEYAFLSDFREKENNPKGQKTCHWKRATLHSLIHRGTAQISCCIHTFFFFWHHWSELFGKNSCCQPPHLYWEFAGLYFKIYHHPGVGGSSISENKHLTKPTLRSGYASGRETSKWSNSTCNINFAFQDNSVKYV